MDLVLKFYLAPHVNKEAYVDDILAQILNVLQVGVLWQFIKDKTGGLVGRRRQGSIMQGLGGDMAARYFVGGALAGRGADLFIIDDPHSEQDALSPTAMAACW